MPILYMLQNLELKYDLLFQERMEMERAVTYGSGLDKIITLIIKRSIND